jgi:predicted porin
MLECGVLQSALCVAQFFPRWSPELLSIDYYFERKIHMKTLLTIPRRLTVAVLIGLASYYVSAQQVQIYGVADIGIESVDNGGGRTVKVTSGLSEGSRFGIKGSEELGNGYKALFTLEARVEYDTGANRNGSSFVSNSASLPPGLRDLVAVGAITAQTAAFIQQQVQQAASTVNGAGALFDRQVYVGMVTPVGGILAGRQYTPGYAAFSFYDATDGATAVSPAQSYIGLLPRASNSVTHVIEGVGSVSTYFMVASGERTDSRKAGSMVGGLIRYKSGPLDIGVGMNRYGTLGASSRSGLRVWTLGASLVAGPTKLYVAQVSSKNPNAITDPTSPNVSEQDIDGTIGALLPTNNRLLHFGAKWVTGANSFVLAFNQVKDKRDSIRADVDHYGFLYRYAFSKRTNLYAAYAVANNKGLARVGLNGTGTAGGFTSDFGVDSKVLQIGVRHSF